MAAAVACAAMLAAASPVGADDAVTELAEAEAELDDRRARLIDVSDRLQQTRLTIEALETAIDVAAGRLADVEDELAVAVERVEGIRRVRRDAVAAVVTTSRALAAAREDVARASAALDDAVALDVKRGAATDRMLGLHGLIGSSSPHTALVALRTAAAMRHDRAAILADRREALRLANERRLEALARQDRAAHAEADARAAEAHVRDLRMAQQRVLDGMQSNRDSIDAVLAELEADHEATAVIVAALEEEVRLHSLALEAVVFEGDRGHALYGPPPAWAVRLPRAGQRWAAMIDGTANRVGVDGRLLASLVWTESAFVSSAQSHVGAYGLGQLMPDTAALLRVDATDPAQNLRGSARYLKWLLQEFGRNDLALAAYNAGPGNVAKYGNTIPPFVETQLYVVRVLDRYAMLTR